MKVHDGHIEMTVIGDLIASPREQKRTYETPASPPLPPYQKFVGAGRDLQRDPGDATRPNIRMYTFHRCPAPNVGTVVQSPLAVDDAPAIIKIRLRVYRTTGYMLYIHV